MFWSKTEPKKKLKRFGLIPLLVILISVCVFFNFLKAANKVRKDGNLNVLLVTLDTTRADRIGCYGYEKAKTPNLDLLASKGVRFANAYCQVPLTLPSHCSILTGTYPIYHRVHNNGFYFLNSDYLTLAEILKDKGFKTAAFVSSFTVDSRFGLNQGFDVYDDKFHAELALKNFRSERKAEKVFAVFSDWLDGNYDQKFFCWLHFFDPHSPYDPPSPFKDQFSDSPYDGEIAYMDHYVGKAIAKLKEKNIFDNTLVILVGDHGEAFGEKNEVDHGLYVYDVTMKVPFIFCSPKHLPQELVIESRVRSIDIMPTILDILKIKVSKEVQGESLLSYITGRKNEDLSSYIETYSPRETYGWSELVGVIADEWKYIKAPKPELYNLQTDPKEERNLIKEEKRIAVSMIEKLDKMIEKYSSKKAPGKKRLTREEEAKLRSLGYLAGELSGITLKKKLPDPKDKIAEYRQYFRAKMHEFQGDFQGAAKYYQELLLSNPEAPWNYVYLALTYQKMEKMEEAIRLLEQGRVKIPDSMVILSRLNFFYLKAERNKEALETCLIILTLNPGDFDALFIAGTIMWKMRKWTEAISYFEKAVEIEPENKTLQFRYAYSFAATGKNEDALKIYMRLMQEYPRDYRIYHEIGFSYDSLGNFEKTRESFKKAVELYPSPVTYFDYAVILEKTGYLKEAIYYLKLYLEKTPEDDTTRKIRAKKALVQWEARLRRR